MMEWQPIETAPKDGTEIDIYIKLETWEDRGPNYYWQPKRKCWTYRHGGDCPAEDVTHWMPLPAPPA